MFTHIDFNMKCSDCNLQFAIPEEAFQNFVNDMTISMICPRCYSRNINVIEIKKDPVEEKEIAPGIKIEVKTK